MHKQVLLAGCGGGILEKEILLDVSCINEWKRKGGMFALERNQGKGMFMFMNQTSDECVKCLSKSDFCDLKPSYKRRCRC